MKFNAQHDSPSPRALERAAGLALGRRRGSVIILAVGVLAALAIIAVAYTVAVRTDRQSAATHQVVATVTGQEKAVAGELGALLAADLFGNKIVTPDLPRWIDNSGAEVAPGASGAVRLWPAMFEDAEFSDYPWVDSSVNTSTFNQALVGQTPSTNAGVELDPFAALHVAPRQDDAWLAASEPVASSGVLNAPWDMWQQISNIRSAYHFVRNGNQSRWVRDTGRFADLGRFFLNASGAALSRPDPEADLTNFDDDPIVTPANSESGPALGRNQQVFHYQMNAMGNDAGERYAQGANAPAPNFTNAFSYEPNDERFWADTDGDLRPDARWQTLDALGNLGGLRWVVAVRIIDSSGQINVNTAIDSGINNTGRFAGFNYLAPTYPTGLNIGALLGGSTPADIDLARLLYDSRLAAIDEFSAGAWSNGGQPGARDLIRSNLPFFHDPLSGNPPRAAFRDHLDSGLHLSDFINERDLASGENQTAQLTYTTPHSASPTWRFTAAERDLIYREFGVAPFEHESTARAYPLADEIDLKTYWAVNNDQTLSALESRLDYGYLPGQASTTNNNPGGAVVAVGPLRSADPTRAERTFQRTNPGAFPRPTVEEIRDDTRHLLTTYSGVADFSPVPVLNTASENGRLVFNDRLYNRKIRLRDFPVNTQGATQAEQQLKDGKKFDLVRRSFEAFTWALAPLATDVPLAPPLTAVDVGANAISEDLHYGGGSTTPAAGPASAIKAITGMDMGASYALLRAASLAVNLADSLDNETPGAAAGAATVEVPTIARLFKVDQRDPIAPPASIADNQGAIELGLRFSHGDVPLTNPSLIPDMYMGAGTDASSAGVTLIGLERQPFLREVTSLAVYQDETIVVPGTSNNIIDPTNTVEQAGAILAIELGNPWPDPIDVRNYRIRIADSGVGASVTIDLSMVLAVGAGSPNTVASSIIGAGQNVVFWISTKTAISPAANWQPIEDKWLADTQNQIAAGGGAPLSAPPGADLMRKLDEATALDPPMPSPVPWQALSTAAPHSVLLLYNAPNGNQYLVDRMSPPAGSTTPFPAVLTAAFNFNALLIPNDPMPGGAIDPPCDVQANLLGAGRLSVAAGLHRPCASPNTPADGFPAYVLERAADNKVARDERINSADFWVISPGPCATPAITILTPLVLPVNGTDPMTNARYNALGEDKETATALPSFQLFVPDAPLVSTSELGSICAFTHMFVHQTPAVYTSGDLASAPTPPAAAPVAPYWLTISEQLGMNAHLAYDASQAPSLTNRNPALGALDFSRFTPSTTAGAGALGPVAAGHLPDSLAIPLASRIFDCFEALDIPEGLAQGRVNLNTAPVKTLRMMPWLAPWFDVKAPVSGTPFLGGIGDETMGGAGSPVGSNLDRGALLAAYRDALQGNPDFNFLTGRQQKTNLFALRTVGERNGAIPAPGLRNLGEVSLLSNWNQTTNGGGGSVGSFTVGAQYRTFTEVGELDPTAGMRLNSGMPAAPAPDVNNLVITDNLMDKRPSAGSNVGGTFKPYDPIDDAEERLAVFRPLANTASTRSDVFTAWFVIRGYDPRRIAAVEIPAGGSDDEKVRAAMNQLTPTHESRWLAVFDRSNVKLPTDRPRLILLSELPVR